MVALDIDGVINVLTDTPRTVAHHVHIDAGDMPRSPFVAGGGLRDLDLTVRIIPAHARWIERTRQVADVVWCTTWEHTANIVIAPLLGIHPLPFIPLASEVSMKVEMLVNADSTMAKRHVLIERYPGRPLVWIDDRGPWYRNWRPGGDPSLAVRPDPLVGLTPAAMSGVTRFLRHHAGYRGPIR